MQQHFLTKIVLLALKITYSEHLAVVIIQTLKLRHRYTFMLVLAWHSGYSNTVWTPTVEDTPTRKPRERRRVPARKMLLRLR